MKETNQKKNSLTRKVIIGVPTLLIVASLVLVFLVTPQISARLDQEDKEHFEQASYNLEQLTREAENSPVYKGSWEGGKACKRPSVKYDTSKEASCIVNYTTSQKFATQEEAERLGRSYESMIRESSIVERFTYNEPRSQDLFQLYDFTFYKTPEKIKCYLINEYKKDDESTIIKSTLDCSGRARDTWFPRSDI